MLLRAGDDWQPVYEQRSLDWIDRGCGREIDHLPRPMASIGWVREALERGDGETATVVGSGGWFHRIRDMGSPGRYLVRLTVAA